MKTLLFAALLAAVPTASQAAVTITFTGATFEPDALISGSFVVDHADGRDDIVTADDTSREVAGTIVIDTVAAGANTYTAPDVYYDGGGASFLTVSFTSEGYTPVQLSGMLTSQAINSDGGIEFNLFNAERTYSYIFLLFGFGPIPTADFGGILLPDFTAADELFFGVVSTVGDPNGDFIQTASLGQAFVTSQTVTPVPEPATWMLMFGGFGLVGVGVRRSRRPVPLLG